VLLVIEKMFLGRLLNKCPAVIQHVYVLFTTLISFVIFSVESMDKLPVFLGGLFGVGINGIADGMTLYNLDSFAVLLAVCIIASTPIPKKLYEKFANTNAGSKLLVVAEPVGIACLLILSTALLVDGSYNPFLYFRF
jgi:alginate O-acetyltransferase complex protein AlgI